ncbi:ATP synthase protein 8 [Photobacterium kishitanii]|nr:ATP synthase protein 8 [Photobacterium kishitanii]
MLYIVFMTLYTKGRMISYYLFIYIGDGLNINIKYLYADLDYQNLAP